MNRQPPLDTQLAAAAENCKRAYTAVLTGIGPLEEQLRQVDAKSAASFFTAATTLRRMAKTLERAGEARQAYDRVNARMRTLLAQHGINLDEDGRPTPPDAA